MDTNAVLTAVVAALAVPGYFGFRAWWAGLLAAAIAFNFPTHALGVYGIVLALFLSCRLARREKKASVMQGEIIDAVKQEDGTWTFPRKSG
jgi:hypothetical protein